MASIGHVISDSGHVEAIFIGLPEEYDTFLIFVIPDQKHIRLKKESLPLAQEARIEKHSKELNLNLGSVNIATHA